MSEAAREYIRQAITDFWGERCDIPDEDCPTCIVWAEFDKAENAIHIQRNVAQDPEGTWSDGGKEWTPAESHPNPFYLSGYSDGYDQGYFDGANAEPAGKVGPE